MKNDETSVFALTTEVLVKSKIVIISGAGNQ
jgi:hypothetical protein